MRVLVDGVWGFASQPLRDESDAVACRTGGDRQRARRGRAAPRSRVTSWRRASAEIGFYQTDAVIDPFAVSPAEREALVLDTLAAAREEPGWCGSQAGVNAKRQHRFFADSEGSLQEQHFVESGGMVLAVAANDHVVQRRSYPNSFHGNTAAAGWEYVRRSRPRERGRAGWAAKPCNS